MAEHRARITWSDEQVLVGLPTVRETIDPAWLDAAVLGWDDAWSLVCSFDIPPREQGNPSMARVRFWMSHAPHDVLRPGARLCMFERGTRQYARVGVLE